MKTLTVELGERSYPIYIGNQLFANPELLTRHIPGKSAVIVTNTTVAPLYLEAVQKMLGDIKQTAVILPDGEEYKDLNTLNLIYDALIEGRFDRKTTLIALGGGVIGDITGFAAASYQRGVNFIQIPTTLLSQVDSSVGGKTGVNHPGGKNMIGAFYQPRCVIANIDTLATLDDRQLRAGIAEVIKYGFIYDRPFADWCMANMAALLRRDNDALSYAIERSCQVKAEVVAADETESGIRAWLNLGHTFGHAIEAHQGYGKWLHGEAVGAGMAMAAELSADLGWISASDKDFVVELIRKAELPVAPPADMSKDDFMHLMAIDKKVENGALRLVLLRQVGEAVVTGDFDPAIFHATLEKLTQK